MNRSRSWLQIDFRNSDKKEMDVDAVWKVVKRYLYNKVESAVKRWRTKSFRELRKL